MHKEGIHVHIYTHTRLKVFKIICESSTLTYVHTYIHTYTQVDEMIREADVNGDGIIDYKEFTKIILN